MITEITTVKSPNCKERSAHITAIVLHSTGGALNGAISWLSNSSSGVSSHIVIGKDGSVHRLVPDNYVAYHAGVSSLFGTQYVNAFSLGVEIENIAGESYPEAQINACAEWVTGKLKQYIIPMSRVVSHKDVAPGRKIDPVNFPFYTFFLKVAYSMAGQDPTSIVTPQAFSVLEVDLEESFRVLKSKVCMPRFSKDWRKGKS